MKKRLKITEGKAHVRMSKTGVCDVVSNGNIIALVGVNSNDAELIADAFNTANKTQLLPSELKEQRGDLLKELKHVTKALEVVYSYGATTPIIEGSKRLINKIEDNE